MLSVLLPHGTPGDVWYVGVQKHLEAVCVGVVMLQSAGEV